ncbi:MAG: hypothetical protein LBU04_04695 [Christensenellaceae bacterium]|nr:hypothetical protein [Christensenellaceae bacterium]
MVKHPAVSLSSQEDPASNAVGVRRREYRMHTQLHSYAFHIKVNSENLKHLKKTKWWSL